MVEPRGSIHIRHDSKIPPLRLEEDEEDMLEPLLEHDEPETPAHPLLEYEIVPAEGVLLDEPRNKQQQQQQYHSKWKLYVSFVFLVISGSLNVVTAKLQAIPMFNYPNFLNLFANFMYIPICFAYIIPVARYGWLNEAISAQQLALPKRPFVVMGALDSLATSLQVFATVYLPGPLLVLLPQAAIPMSMVFSKYILKERFDTWQYAGAMIVLIGILVVLEPVYTHRRSPDYYCEAINVDNDCTICQVEATQEDCLSHQMDHSLFSTSESIWRIGDNSTDDDANLCQWLPFEEAVRQEEVLMFVWSLVMIASCIPRTLSTIYKQIALKDEELDPIYLNGWIAVFQFFFSLIVAVPAGMFATPSVQPLNLLRNLWDGIRCYVGHGSIDTGCHPDSMCSFHGALFVNLFLLSTVLYSFFMMYVLKYGSTALLFLALTIMLPIGNLAFSLPFMPQAATLHGSDLLGLAVIMTGLILYRFSDAPRRDDVVLEEEPTEEPTQEDTEQPVRLDTNTQDSLREPLIKMGDV